MLEEDQHSQEYCQDTLRFLYDRFEVLQTALVEYERERKQKHWPVIRPIRVVVADKTRDYRLLASQLSDWRVTVKALPPHAFENQKRLTSELEEQYEYLTREYGAFLSNEPVVRPISS